MSNMPQGPWKSHPREKKKILPVTWASLVTQKVKCLPAIQETWVQFPGWKDPLEKEMATHSSTLAWKIPWMEETGRLQFMGSQSQTMTGQLHSLIHS